MAEWAQLTTQAVALDPGALLIAASRWRSADTSPRERGCRGGTDIERLPGSRRRDAIGVFPDVPNRDCPIESGKTKGGHSAIRRFPFLALFPLVAFTVAAQDAAFKPVVAAEYGFEGGQTQGWVTRGNNGAAVSFKDVAHSGDSGLGMSDRTVDWHCPRVELTKVLERGAKYHIELWARLNAGERDAAMYAIMLTRYPGNDVEDSITGDVNVASTGWTRLEGDFVWDPQAAGAFLYVLFRGSPTAIYYVDDVKITKNAASAPMPAATLDVFSYGFEKNGTQGRGPRGDGV
jgi:hypothetical protein